MKYRTLVLFVALIFLITHGGCAPVNKSQMQTTPAYPENPVNDFAAQKQKEEREWLLMVLLVLGIAIVLGATISASSGGGGFSLGVNN
jgi:hypothetical protein